MRDKRLLLAFLALLGLTLIAFFLNCLSNIYSGVDFFCHDLNEIRKKEQEKLEKLDYIVKNNHSLSLLICVVQVVINFVSAKFLANILEYLGYNSSFILFSILPSFFLAILIEVLPR